MYPGDMSVLFREQCIFDDILLKVLRRIYRVDGSCVLREALVSKHQRLFVQRRGRMCIFIDHNTSFRKAIALKKRQILTKPNIRASKTYGREFRLGIIVNGNLRKAFRVPSHKTFQVPGTVEANILDKDK